MPFAYYDKLTRRQQATYRKSDGIAAVTLNDCEPLRNHIAALEQALAAGERKAITAACGRLCRGICKDQGTAPVSVRVLARRPASATEELHGLYELFEDRPARITVWMRTAARRQVVAFRSFLRTVLHELCHHLDYLLLELDDSYHTEGFFRRESSLFGQLAPEAQQGKRTAAKKTPRKPGKHNKISAQLDLF